VLSTSAINKCYQQVLLTSAINKGSTHYSKTALLEEQCFTCMETFNE